MPKQPATATWTQIDPATLPTAVAKQYARYKDAYTEMKAERQSFEDGVRALINIPDGKRAVFGYNFGKLSVAIVDDIAKPASTKGALSLSAFLANSGGRRT